MSLASCASEEVIVALPCQVVFQFLPPRPKSVRELVDEHSISLQAAAKMYRQMNGRRAKEDWERRRYEIFEELFTVQCLSAGQIALQYGMNRKSVESVLRRGCSDNPGFIGGNTSSPLNDESAYRFNISDRFLWFAVTGFAAGVNSSFSY